MLHTKSQSTFYKLISTIQTAKPYTSNSSRDIKQANFIKYNRSNINDQGNKPISRSAQENRFTKHSNLVQTNKHILHYLNQSRTGEKHKPLFQIKKIANNKTFCFQPKREEDLMRKYRQPLIDIDLDEVKLDINSQNLEKVLHKNQLKSHRNLMGYNILYLQKKFNYSRFDLHTLYSVYHTLLRDSKNSLKRFKNGFEVMLNMNKVAVRPEVLQKIFSEQKSVDFQSFIEMYSKIDQVIFKQNIIDYVQILFEGVYDKEKIRFEDIIRVMRNRITEKESVDIAKIIYEQYDKSYSQMIKLADIYELCHSCDTFAKKMYRLYTRQFKCQ